MPTDAPFGERKWARPAPYAPFALAVQGRQVDAQQQKGHHKDHEKMTKSEKMRMRFSQKTETVQRC